MLVQERGREIVGAGERLLVRREGERLLVQERRREIVGAGERERMLVKREGERLFFKLKT